MTSSNDDMMAVVKFLSRGESLIFTLTDVAGNVCCFKGYVSVFEPEYDDVRGFSVEMGVATAGEVQVYSDDS